MASVTTDFYAPRIFTMEAAMREQAKLERLFAEYNKELKPIIAQYGWSDGYTLDFYTGTMYVGRMCTDGIMR
jgi:ABC-type Fe3+ transport system substrate-binding protein